MQTCIVRQVEGRRGLWIAVPLWVHNMPMIVSLLCTYQGPDTRGIWHPRVQNVSYPFSETQSEQEVLGSWALSLGNVPVSYIICRGEAMSSVHYVTDDANLHVLIRLTPKSTWSWPDPCCLDE